MNIKTIKLETKFWFDTIYGNSYFSSRIKVNDDIVIYIPFQYGYGSHDETTAFKELQKQGIIPQQDDLASYWQYYRDNNIEYTRVKKQCRKTQVVMFAKKQQNF